MLLKRKRDVRKKFEKTVNWQQTSLNYLDNIDRDSLSDRWEDYHFLKVLTENAHCVLYFLL